MLDFNFSEMLVVVVIALVVIGPKELPRLLYKLGQWVGKARAFVANFQNQIEEMGRESELAKLREELELANQKLAHSGIDPNRTIHSAPEVPPPVASAEPAPAPTPAPAKPKPKPKPKPNPKAKTKPKAAGTSSKPQESRQ